MRKYRHRLRIWGGVRVVRHFLAGESVLGRGVVRNESERTGRVHEQNEGMRFVMKVVWEG